MNRVSHFTSLQLWLSGSRKRDSRPMGKRHRARLYEGFAKAMLTHHAYGAINLQTNFAMRLAWRLLRIPILNSTPTQTDWSPASHSPQRHCLKCVRSIPRRKGFAMMIPKFLQTAYCSRSPGKLQAPESTYPAHNGSGKVGY